jgi:phosphoheptose isomerase
MKLPRQPLAVVQSLATKQVVKQFANKFDFVYFGQVDARVDEHQLVRGVTVSGNHSDDNYAVGDFKGHDVTIVERRASLQATDNSKVAYRWMIMQVDLHRSGLPHIFIDALHHEETFYTDLFMKFGRLETAMALFGHYDPLFVKYFKAFAKPIDFMIVGQVVTQELATMIAHHFRQFTYEINDDYVLIYSDSNVVTMNLLQEMMRIGVWIADQLDKSGTR